MCLAEALLRIPDADTIDRLIRDKIGPADWQKHMGQSASLFVNASTWALMLTGRVVKLDPEDGEPAGLLRRLVQRSGEPVIRQAVTAAMRILGRQFVMGRTIDEALETARPAEKTGYRHSYDMLGESARTAGDAQRYFESYRNAIGKIGAAVQGRAIAGCALDLGQALGAASALRGGAARPRGGRAAAAGQGARGRGQAPRHGFHHRCRGGRSA